jgi:hypothetical protein
MSDTALLSLKVPTLHLLVLLVIVVFKTKMRISMEHLWCGTDRVAGKNYSTWCKSRPTLILSTINLTCIGPGSNPDIRGNIHSLLYALNSVPRREHAIFTRVSYFLNLFSIGSWWFIFHWFVMIYWPVALMFIQIFYVGSAPLWTGSVRVSFVTVRPYSAQLLLSRLMYFRFCCVPSRETTVVLDFVSGPWNNGRGVGAVDNTAPS